MVVISGFSLSQFTNQRANVKSYNFSESLTRALIKFSENVGSSRSIFSAHSYTGGISALSTSASITNRLTIVSFGLRVVLVTFFTFYQSESENREYYR